MTMALRLSWLALCAGIAFVAMAVQMDWGSVKAPAVADKVPGPFRTRALVPLAGAAAQGNDMQTLAALSVEAVRVRPVSAEPLMLLGGWRQLQGREDLASAAFGAAAGRGWRNAPLQAMMVEAAMAADMPEVAVDRLQALWAIDVDSPMLQPATALVIADPVARRLFARRIAGSHTWPDIFVDWGGKNLDPADFAATVREAIDAGGRLACQALSDAARELVLGLHTDAARAIWAGDCARLAGSSEASDMGFQNRGGDAFAGPFDWSYPAAAGLARSLRKEGGRTVMDFSNADPVAATLAQRFWQFAPGEHVLAADGIGSGAPEIILKVVCIAPGEQYSGAARAILNEGPVRFVIPAAGCSLQRIILTAGTGKLEGLSIRAAH